MAKSVSLPIQVAILAVLLAVAGGLWLAREQVGEAVAGLTGRDSGETRKKRGGGERGVPVIVTTVASALNDETIAAVGTGRARRSVMLHPKSDGVIMAFGPSAGDRVKAGEMVFALDTTQAELAVELAKSRLEDAERQLERQEQLKRRQVASSAKVTDIRLVAERARLELRQAEKVLKDLRITAPFDGIVGLPKVEVGDRVSTTAPVISLDTRDELLVEFPMPERYVTRIKQGDKVHATTPGFGDRRFEGHIAAIDSRIDPTSRTVMLRAVIPNRDDLLRPGMSFAVELVLPGKTYPSVPELSLQWREGESYVWLVRDKRATKVLVETVQRQRGRVLVDGPIKTGDLVVVEGVQRLRDGRPVSHDPPDKAKPGPAARQSTSPQAGVKG